MVRLVVSLFVCSFICLYVCMIVYICISRHSLPFSILDKRYFINYIFSSDKS